MNENDMVPCSLGQVCVRETTKVEGYLPIAIFKYAKMETMTWFDQRPEFRGNYFFLERPKDRDVQYVIVDQKTFDIHYSIPQIQLAFQRGDYMIMKWTPKNKYMAREQLLKLKTYYWLYDEVYVPTPKAVEVEEPKAVEVEEPKAVEVEEPKVQKTRKSKK